MERDAKSMSREGWEVAGVVMAVAVMEPSGGADIEVKSWLRYGRAGLGQVLVSGSTSRLRERLESLVWQLLVGRNLAWGSLVAWPGALC